MSDVVVKVPTVVVSEVFGPTLQGEGRLCGQPAWFIRLGHCNLDCSWCDTPYTWDWTRFDRHTELTKVSVPDLVAHVDGGPRLVVVTGGEPLVQAPALHDLVRALVVDGGKQVQIETNGTITPSPPTTSLVRWWSVSPKLPHATSSLVVRSPRADEAARRLVTLGADFKFVCQTVDDLAHVDRYVADHQVDPTTVWIMPEGVDTATITERAAALVEPSIARGYNLTTRLHVLLWGDTRGR